jgi:hypothetical protein
MKLRAVTDFTLLNGFQTPDTAVHTASAQPDVGSRSELENEAASLQGLRKDTKSQSILRV